MFANCPREVLSRQLLSNATCQHHTITAVEQYMNESSSKAVFSKEIDKR